MRAMVLTGPGEASLQDIAEPPRDKTKLLLKVELVGLCGTDLNSFRGKNPLITFPRVPGHEIAATVAEGSARVPSGSRVTVSPYTSCGKCASCLRGRPNACQDNQTFGVQRDGALTRYIQVPDEKIFPSSSLPLQSLCLVEPLTVGFHAVARGRVTSEDTVAVFGCGGVGLGAIAGAAFRGARTIAVDVDDSKLATAKSAGATDTVNSAAGNLVEQLLNATAGRGPDVIVEAIGLPQTYLAAVQAVAFTGRVVYIGYAKEPVAFQTDLFVKKEIDILGSRNALPEDFAQVIAMLEAGHFPVESAVSAIVALAEAPMMLRKWSEQPAAYTKIMVQVGA